LLRDELLAAIAQWDERLDGGIEPNTSLIASGRLDSVQLVLLLEWIEEKAGKAIDATVVDIANDWDTVDGIVAFVEQARDEP
jgi:acyl carrier protein